jgi:hypothetical protein
MATAACHMNPIITTETRRWMVVVYVVCNDCYAPGDVGGNLLYACYFSFGQKRKVQALHFLGCVPQFSVFFCHKTMQNLPSPATRTRGMHLDSAHRWTALLHLRDHSDSDASDDGLGTSMQRQHCVTCRKTGPAASPYTALVV